MPIRKLELEDIQEELNFPVKDLYSAAIMLCLAIGFGKDSKACEHCPVHIFDYHPVTKYEKQVLHEPCQTNLYKWLIEQAIREKNNET
jgi:hypothetical protein